MPTAHPIKILPTREYLLACLDYDPATGALTWKRRPREHFSTPSEYERWNARYANKGAGSPHPKGYLQVQLGLHFLAHRIIWKWMTDEEPPDSSPDHKNGDRRDNRWANLRPATATEQNWNSRRSKPNVSGFRGVYQLSNGRYLARLQAHNRRRSLGVFDTAGEASAAYEAVARELHGEFYCPPMS